MSWNKRFVDSSTLKSRVASASAANAGTGGATSGIVEYCETTMLERNQSRHRALNELGAVVTSPASAAVSAPRQTILSRSGSLVNVNDSGVGRSGSSGGLGYVLSRQASSSLANTDTSEPTSPRPTTDATPLIGKRQKRTCSVNSIPSILECYSSGFVDNKQTESQDNTIRFQVVVWHIGQIDMVQGRVPIPFRVTVFWNAPPDDLDTPTDEAVSQTGSQKSQYAWRMLGRQQAFQTDVKDSPVTTVDVFA